MTAFIPDTYDSYSWSNPDVDPHPLNRVFQWLREAMDEWGDKQRCIKCWTVISQLSVAADRRPRRCRDLFHVAKLPWPPWTGGLPKRRQNLWACNGNFFYLCSKTHSYHLHFSNCQMFCLFNIYAVITLHNSVDFWSNLLCLGFFFLTWSLFALLYQSDSDLNLLVRREEKSSFSSTEKNMVMTQWKKRDFAKNLSPCSFSWIL